MEKVFNNFKYSILLTLLSAMLMGISLYPYFGFLAWFGFIPFIYVLNNTNCYKKIILLSFIWGLFYHFVGIFWLWMNVGTTPLIAWTSMIGSILVLSLNTILFGIIWHRLRLKFSKLKFILFVMTWVSVEFIRSYGFLGFPWVSIANSQLDYFSLIQNVEITGIYGISFWIMLINIYLFQIFFINRDKRNIILLILIFIFPWISGKILLKQSEKYIDTNKEYITAIISQPNIKQTDKNNIIKCDSLVSELSKRTNDILYNDADLVIWPETIPYYASDIRKPNSYFLKYLPKSKEMVYTSNKFLLFGAEIVEGENYYNSSILVDTTGIINYYYKQQLVPLVEYFPYADKIPFIKAPFSKGNKDKIFNINGINIIGLVCFESTFPDLNRRPINSDEGVDAIVYVINDGWYEEEPEPSQHARQSIFRAIENRRPVLRCANTGISMYINEKGQIVKSLPLNSKGEIDNIRIYKKNKRTFYTRFGNVFALMLLIINMLFLIKSYFENENKI